MADSLDTLPPGASTGPYRVLARKYRPQSFEALIGQEPMVRTLTNAFEAGRIAQAWMLTGVRGVGKTTTARILARALNYQTDTVDRPSVEMPEEGVHDRAIMEGRHVDVVEMDAASHTGIDDIREIIAQVRYRPVSARYKVYIIDEVHMLSTQAFNGLLKTLEEPPEHVKFVFATTEIRKVPITVLSRCQRFDLRRVPAAEMIAHLRAVTQAESVEVEEEALRLIARASEGSVRDALSLTDQAIAHGAGIVTGQAVRDMLGLADRARIVDLFDHLMRGDGGAALSELREQYASGADPVVVLTDLADFTHLVTSLRYVPEAASDASLAPAEAERGADFAARLSVRTLSQTWQMLLKAIEEARQAASPMQAAEMALIRIAHAADLPGVGELLAMLRSGQVPEMPAALTALASPSAPPSPPAAEAPRPASAPRAAASPPPAPAAPQPSASSTERGAAGPSGGYPSLPQSTNAPVASASRGPNLAAMMRATAPETVPVVAPASVPSEALPRSLDDLAELAKSEIRMRTSIRRYLRLKSIEPGHLEASLAEGAPASLANDLSRRLFEWTGRRYVVSLSPDGGGETLEERDAARRRALIEAAEADPDVAAILAAMPGAKVKEVRLRGEPEAPEAADLFESAEATLVDDSDLPEQIDSDPWDGAGGDEVPDEIFEESEDEDEDEA